jgi:iron(III) transport system substrate-binding protein
MMAVTISLSIVGMAGAASEPKTVSEIALYQGPDREKILIEGAKEEGQLIYYTSITWLRTGFVKAFEKKYPFVKVSSWLADSPELLKRVTEEYAAKRYLVDVFETTSPATDLLFRAGMLQEFYSPEISYYGDEVKAKGKIGVYYCGDREIYLGLGFNTKLISPAEAPKTLKDLLDPKWKGKMSISGHTTGNRWIGNCLEAMGLGFIEGMSRQDMRVQNLSGMGLAGLVVSGEVPLSPTIFDSNVANFKGKGAPMEWRPLEPVVTNTGYSGICAKAIHPYSALLFLNYLFSEEGQKIVMQGGLNSPRTDLGTLERKFKKTYLEKKYSLEELEKKFNEWDSLLTRLFIQKQ